MMDDIEYTSKDGSGLDDIGPLWEKLNRLHLKLSPDFSQFYAGRDFAWRKAGLLDKAAGGLLRIDLVREKDSGRLVGYCVSTVSAEKQGEIDPIYVEEDCRGRGIGDRLMTGALDWLDGNRVESKILGVAAGNEAVLGFYRRFNFYPRSTKLQQLEGR